MAKKKQRADVLLVQKGLVESREKAKRLIMAGQVFFLKEGEWYLVDKPGNSYLEDTEFKLKEKELFVSRGGYKLLTAIEFFKLELKNKVCLDVGASTGGFTDCLLQHGAKRVYAVDVGTGQLDYRLRQDTRVINLEKINMRYAKPDLLPELVDFLTIDCSFISLKLVLPPSLQFLKPKGEIVTLIKPQFEVGKGETKKGVVISETKQLEVVEDIKYFLENKLQVEVKGVVPSKIKGPKGNQEYLLYGVYLGVSE